eukprot:165235_1
MTESNVFPITSTIYAMIMVMIAILIMMRMLYIKCSSSSSSNNSSNIYYATLFSVLVFNLVILSIGLIFLVHTINNTPLEYEDEIGIFVLDHMYTFFYVWSMASMNAVFLLRIQFIFSHVKAKEYVVKEERIRSLWTAIIILTITGTAASIIEMFTSIPALITKYILASIYIGVLFALSSYLLYIFISKLKKMHQMHEQFSNEADKMQLYKLMIKTTIIARFAIFSTFTICIIAAIVDMIDIFFMNENNDFKYLKRHFFLTDSVIGALAISLTLSQNNGVYKFIFGCFEQKYFPLGSKSSPQLSDAPQVSDGSTKIEIPSIIK